jgi:hypothetical protein
MDSLGYVERKWDIHTWTMDVWYIDADSTNVSVTVHDIAG